jgi:hypothetical protein
LRGDESDFEVRRIQGLEVHLYLLAGTHLPTLLRIHLSPPFDRKGQGGT